MSACYWFCSSFGNRARHLTKEGALNDFNSFECYILKLGTMVHLQMSILCFRVKIRTEDGHLMFIVADDRNISLLTGRNGAILFNGEDITSSYQTVICNLVNY